MYSCVETIVLKDTKLEEINKYYIQDNLTEIDRINHLLKKGYLSQKEHLIQQIHTYFLKGTCPSFITSIIKQMIDNIEIYDKQLQIAFASSLSNLAQQLPFTSVKGINTTEIGSLIKTIILHFYKAISTLEKSVSDEYVTALNSLVECYHSHKYRLDGLEEIIDYATSLGKFGQNTSNRRFSVYFCICTIRICNEKSSELSKRLQYLCEDSDRVVRYELGYQIRYVLLQESNDKEFIKKAFVEHLMNYFKEEHDLLYKAILLESLLLNIRKFDNVFIDFISKVIDEMIGIDDFYTLSNEFGSFVYLFENLLKVAIEMKEYRNIVVPFMTKFIRKFFKNNELKNSTNVTITLSIDYVFLNFANIAKVYSEMNDVISLLLVINSLLFYAYNDKEHMIMFYEGLSEAIIYIAKHKEIISKAFIQKVFFFLEGTEENNEMQEISYSNQNIMPILKELKEHWMKDFDNIIKAMVINDIEDFFILFNNKGKLIESLVSKTDDWRKQISIFKALQYLPQYLTFNYIRYPTYDEILVGYYNFTKLFLSKEHNIILVREVMKFLAISLPYIQSKCDIATYIKDDFILSKSFYRRRLSVFFFEGAFDSLSKDYLNDNDYYQLGIDLINDDIVMIQCSIIALYTQRKMVDKDICDTINAIKNKQNDAVLRKTIEEYKTMHKNSSFSGENKKRSEEEECGKRVNEMKIKEIENKIIENAKKDEVCLIKKKKARVKANGINSNNNSTSVNNSNNNANNQPGGTGGGSIKKTSTKGSTISSKLTQKFEDSHILKKERKSSMKNIIGEIDPQGIKSVSTFHHSSTPKTLTELRNKK